MWWKDDHEWWLDKDLKGGDHGLFAGMIPAFTGKV
jgi:hypothetical protein